MPTIFPNNAPMRQFMLASVASACFAMPGHACAQASAETDEREEYETTGEDIDTIVVTGFRQSETESVHAKREASTVIDAVSSDNIGRLPDQNTAAALRRIPGISVQNDQNEPRFPVIRGLPPTYNRTQINGQIVASADNGGSREIPLDIIPSTLAARLEVVKTVLPEMDPNAIGGIINIVTKSPLSETGPFLSATGGVTYYEQSNDVASDRLSWRGNATGGTQFGDEGQFGVIATINHSVRNYDITQFESANPSFREYTDSGRPVDLGDPQGNGIPVPIMRRLFLYNNVRERIGGALGLEWDASPALEMRLFGSYNKFSDTETRHENRLQQTGNVQNQTPTTGLFAIARDRVGLNLPKTEREIYTGQFEADLSLADSLGLELDAVYSGATGKENNRSETFQTPNGADFGFTYDAADFFFDFFPVNPAAVDDPARHAFSGRTEAFNSTVQDIYEGRAALTYESFDPAGDLEVKLGGLFRQTDHARDSNVTSFSIARGSGLTYTLADVFARNERTVVGGQRFGLFVDSAASEAFFQANRASFTSSENNVLGDYAVKESVYGGFFQVRGTAGDVQVIGGVRYERTDVESSASRVVNGVIEPALRSGGYGDFLPSLHLRWNVASDLVLRAAYTNTLSRPDFGDITAAETISFTGGARPTLTRGNPDLRPRRSQGLDGSVEYYTDNGGLLSLAVFYKDIEDEIFTLTSIQQIDLGLSRGVETVEISQPQNAQSASLLGVEAALQQGFTFLPAPFDGLGVNLNATYIDSDLTFLTAAGPRQRGFFFQPEWSANAAVYYEKGPFSARVAYNYTGGFLETINSNIPAADQFWKWRDTLDAQVRLRLSDRIELFAEGENLTNTGRRELTGPNRDLLQEAATFGRAFTLGAAVKL